MELLLLELPVAGRTTTVGRKRGAQGASPTLSEVVTAQHRCCGDHLDDPKDAQFLRATHPAPATPPRPVRPFAAMVRWSLA